MFSSLRTRLWLTYLLLILTVLVVVAAGLILAFYENPRVLYPDVVYRLRLIGQSLPDQLAKLASQQEASFLLKQASEAEQVRLILFDAKHKILIDTGGETLPFVRLARNIQLNPPQPDQVRIFRDNNRKPYLYLVRFLSSGHILLVIRAAPVLPLAVLIRDQFFSTFFIGGAIALVLAFLMALAMGSWISSPLRRMVSASQAVARGEFSEVQVKGPREVQELAEAMNEMSQKVQDSQQALRAKEQAQRDFVANVSHELKTPVTSIQGFAQAILDGAAQTPEALQQAANVIYNEAARMNRLVLDLLSLARLESGTADLQHAPVDLRMLLLNVIEKFSPQASMAQVSLVSEIGDIPPVIGDGDRLAQVFTNLVDNAIKFTPPGGQINVNAQASSGSVSVQISDTGKGIPMEDQSRIFDRFFQSDKSRRGGAGRGFGLGLPIARQIVLAHGGTIWVESQPGQGSRFVVKIPLAGGSESADSIDSNRTYSFKSKR